jgi:penicillin-binding protein 2
MEIRDDLSPVKRRSAVVLIAVFVAVAALNLRLAELQLAEASMWRQRAENNRLRRVPLASPRGRIYDRRGRVMADNLATWQLLLFPDEARDLDDTVLFLARTGVVRAGELREQLETRRIGRLAPLVVAEDLSWAQVASIRSHQSDHPELAVVSGFRRHYPPAELTAHAVGHLRMLSREEAQAAPELDPNVLLGATGIEALRNPFLAGRDGERYVVVSAVGRELGVVRGRAARSGRDLGSTIDLDLQGVAAEALGEYGGSVVALDPTSGAVRVLYSAPSFDPNLFAGRLSRQQWGQLSQDERHPLQDRSIQGVYPPGSTIKPFLALAGITDETIPPQWSVSCRGRVTLHGHPFRCWRRSGHGTVHLERSLEVSCDSFYYLLGQTLGIGGIARWLSLFGFEQPTGIGIGPEATGLIGTPEWSRRVRGTPWYPGEVVSMSIGQGPLLVTPLQLARAYAALANGGTLVTPYIAEPSPDPAGLDLGLDPEALARVVEGLRLVTHGTEGTARSLARLPVAGKTGTSQVARLQEGVEVEDLPTHLRHHAWFVAWAPLDRPRLVVAVIVEHGGGGGSVAAPVARAVLETALDRESS